MERNVITRQCLSQIARFHAWPDWLVLDRIIMVADAIDSKVTSFAEPNPEKLIRQP